MDEEEALGMDISGQARPGWVLDLLVVGKGSYYAVLCRMQDAGCRERKYDMDVCSLFFLGIPRATLALPSRFQGISGSIYKCPPSCSC